MEKMNYFSFRAYFMHPVVCLCVPGSPLHFVSRGLSLSTSIHGSRRQAPIHIEKAFDACLDLACAILIAPLVLLLGGRRLMRPVFRCSGSHHDK